MKVLYAGDACTKIGPVFVASPFNLEVKGVSHHIWGQPLIDALTADGIEVKHLTNDQAIGEFPRTEEELAEYDVVIISDCEAEVLSLYPFWVAGTPLPRTDRMRAIRNYAKNGGGLMMIGGWSSFSGRFGTGAYYDTPVEEALPVNCLKGADDRVEVPAGVKVKVLDKAHPIMQDIPWEDARRRGDRIAAARDLVVRQGPLRCVCKRLLAALGGVFPAVGILRKVLGPGRALAGRGRKIRTQQ